MMSLMMTATLFASAVSGMESTSMEAKAGEAFGNLGTYDQQPAQYRPVIQPRYYSSNIADGADAHDKRQLTEEAATENKAANAEFRGGFRRGYGYGGFGRGFGGGFGYGGVGRFGYGGFGRGFGYGGFGGIGPRPVVAAVIGRPVIRPVIRPVVAARPVVVARPVVTRPVVVAPAVVVAPKVHVRRPVIQPRYYTSDVADSHKRQLTEEAEE